MFDGLCRASTSGACGRRTDGAPSVELLTDAECATGGVGRACIAEARADDAVRLEAGMVGFFDGALE